MWSHRAMMKLLPVAPLLLLLLTTLEARPKPEGVDMCMEQEHGCQHSCVSTPSSFYCECNPGYRLNMDGKTCSPIDACADGRHGCQHQCVSARGSYSCRCRAGYYLNQDKRTCSMIDYCSFGNHSCQHECVSIPNGHYCRCRSGFTLQPDARSCRGMSQCGGTADTFMSCPVPRGSVSLARALAQMTARLEDLEKQIANKK
ncbi:hypothetical protein llap_16482 [Limosa lapponica baueri]|uniref:EGF-like domain-containing protein n=1 Tax=Limosa lapponica baueri TaxID=1758121 RepID=A0A2I0THD2_LIMLA|nr:hypothetical protein llap_16482 [Limosa lapponica baueri]